MSTKEIFLGLAEPLAPDATLSDAIYELEFRRAVEQALAELDRGEGIPIEEVKADWKFQISEPRHRRDGSPPPTDSQPT